MSHPRTPPGTLRQTISRRLPKRPDDRGLTTLEWLLIVAAVAGLAALAVVLVQNVVSDTSEQIAGSSARKTAAQIAAVEVTDDARSKTATNDAGAVTLNTEYKSKCKRLEITYGDVENLTVVWSADITASTVTAGDVSTSAVWDATTKVFGCIVT